MERSRRKTREGVVLSNKMQKTVVVEIERKFRHPLYDKIIRRHKKVKAHDEENSCQIGDKVLIIETRPLSKDKYFRVVEILGHSKGKVDIKEPEFQAKMKAEAEGMDNAASEVKEEGK